MVLEPAAVIPQPCATLFPTDSAQQPLNGPWSSGAISTAGITLGVSILSAVSLQTIRTSLLDLREKAYERSGQGSSYLFRVDENWAVDATRKVSK